MKGYIRANLRQAYKPAAAIIFAFVGFFSPGSGMAQNVINLQEYSFANSPLLISPQVFPFEGGLLLVANARFMNDCLANAGIDARFVDLIKEMDDPGLLKDRIIFLNQRIAPAGCPDMFSPVVRPVEVFFQQTENVERLHFLDHVVLGKSPNPMTPPISLPISSPVRNHKSEPNTLRVEAHPTGNVGPGVPILSSVGVTEVSNGQTISYSVDITMPMPSGDIAENTFAARRYETRIGDDEKSPVIDWLVILWKKNMAEIKATGKKEKTTFRINLEGAGSPQRQLGLVNSILGFTYKSQESPFAFFKVN